jgi:carbamoyltransferase
MKIFSVALSPHDHNTYDGILHNQRERYTRLKRNQSAERERDCGDDGAKFYNQYFKPNQHEILAFTTTIGGVYQLEIGLGRKRKHIINEEFLNFKRPEHLWDYKMIGNQYYIDHHQSHAAYAFLTSGFKQSDILAIDGRGWKYRCIFIDKSGKITNLSDKINIGEQWNRMGVMLDLGTHSAGKLMSLAAYGKYDPSLHLALEMQYHREGKKYFLKNGENKLNGKNIAATLQNYTMELIHEYVLPLKSCDNICIAGGVAYNGYMNEEFTKYYNNVHVPPAPGDEGQSLGTYMHADFILNKNIHIPNTYSGNEYDFNEGEPITPEEVGKAISDGNIVGWFNGKAESGNRALGNRSILADPRNPKIKDIINQTIKLREDFRPFAPAVMEEHYKTYFQTNQPSPHMSRIVPVKSDKIPGVTHIDKTARIQTVNAKQNRKFYRVIEGFYKSTGIPMVLNTSFNCREPIVETPEQAINTFNKTKLDMVVINGRYLRKKNE